MLMLDRRTLLRAGSAAVGAAALAPTAPALAHAPQAVKQRSLASTASSSAPSRSPSSATARSRSPPKRCGAIGPRTQEACSHPRSSRLARWGCKSTPFSSTPATSWC